MLDFLGEILLDLILDGSLEGAMNPKTPKPVRWLLGGILLLFYMGLFGMIAYIGLTTMKTNLAGGIVMLGVAVVLAVLTVVWVYKKIRERNTY